MIAAARANAAGIPNVRWLLGDVLTLEVETGGYDIVTAIASVHHLPLAAGLARLASLVRPGGCLAILGLYREAALSDYVAGALAIPVDTAVGIGKALSETLGESKGRSPAARPPRCRYATLRPPCVRSARTPVDCCLEHGFTATCSTDTACCGSDRRGPEAMESVEMRMGCGYARGRAGRSATTPPVVLVHGGPGLPD